MRSADFRAARSPGVRAIDFKAGHAIQALLLSTLVFGFFVALAYLLEGTNTSGQTSLAVAHAGGAAALLVCWRLGRWGRARFSSFGAVLLLVAVAFRLHAMLDALAYGTRVEEMYRYPTLPVSDPAIDLLLKGEVITVLGLMLVACSWRFGVGAQVERYTVQGDARQVPLKLALGVYLTALLLDIVERVLGAGFGPLQQLAMLLFNFGVAAIYFIAAHARSRGRQVLAAGLLGFPLLLLALTSGMKEEMFFPLIPAVVLYWTRYSSIAARGSVLVLGIALLALSQLYVHYVRDTTWRSTGDLHVSTGELVEGFVDQFGAMRMSDALDAVSSRVNMTITHATSVTLADNLGYEPMEVFGLIPASLVPRVLWPGKPVMQPGAMQTARILGGRIPISEIRSATAAGFSTELYLGGWWIGVVFGCVIYGSLLAWAQKLSLRLAPGFGHQALCFLVLYWTLRFDEKHIVYAFTSVIFTLVVVWLLGRASRALGFMPRTSAAAMNH